MVQAVLQLMKVLQKIAHQKICRALIIFIIEQDIMLDFIMLMAIMATITLNHFYQVLAIIYILLHLGQGMCLLDGKILQLMLFMLQERI